VQVERQVENTQARTGAGLGAFFALTYGISWLVWWAMATFRIPGGSVSSDQPAPPAIGLLLLALGGFAPSIAGVVMTWRVAGRAGLRELWRRCIRFDLGVRPYLVIFLAPALTGGARVVVQLLRGGSLTVPDPLGRPALLVGLTLQLFLFGPLSEELGWRGFALDRLLARWSGLRSSLLLGAIHALWHLPLFFVPGTIQYAWGAPALHFAMFAVGTIGGAIVFTWLHMAARRSIWAAILFHLTSNYSTSLVWMSFNGGLVDMLVLALAWVAVSGVLVRPSIDRWLAAPGHGPIPPSGFEAGSSPS
jgi:membrane protease YdiL (CAAX protease family)